MKRDDALRKVRALFRLTESRGASEQEADTAMRQARALMDQFEIGEAEAIEADLSRTESVIKKSVSIDHVTAERSVLSAGIAKLFDCHCSLTGDAGHPGEYGFFGYGPDVEVACWMFEYLIECAVRSASEYGRKLIEVSKASDSDLRSIKRAMAAYHRGFVRRVASRVWTLVEERKHAPAPTIKALTLHKWSAIEEKFGEFSYDNAAYVDPEGLDEHLNRGAADGDSVDLRVRPIPQQEEDRQRPNV